MNFMCKYGFVLIWIYSIAMHDTQCTINSYLCSYLVGNIWNAIHVKIITVSIYYLFAYSYSLKCDLSN